MGVVNDVISPDAPGQPEGEVPAVFTMEGVLDVLCLTVARALKDQATFASATEAGGDA